MSVALLEPHCCALEFGDVGGVVVHVRIMRHGAEVVLMSRICPHQRALYAPPAAVGEDRSMTPVT